VGPDGSKSLNSEIRCSVLFCEQKSYMVIDVLCADNQGCTLLAVR
jgi:hypothetical protein